MWIICDLDGTLSDSRSRAHWAVEKKWDEFHKGLGSDRVVKAVWEVLNALTPKYPIALCTGRPERYREETLKWLRENRVPWSRLLMRPDADFRADWQVKHDLVRVAAIPPDHTLFVLEDRDRMVEMWRTWGYTCFQVARGTF